MSSRKRRAAATTAAVAVLALAGGVAAQFSATTSSAPQSIGTGTVALTINNVAPMTWTDDISNLAAGDSVERFLDLRNSGTLDIFGVTLDQTNTLGALLNAPSDISVKFEACSVAWNTTDGTCGGTISSTLGSSSVASWSGAKALKGMSPFAASDVRHFKLTTTLATTATNAVQGKSGTITYTFGGVQRGGQVAISTAPDVESVAAGASVAPDAVTASAAEVSLPVITGATSYDLRYATVANAQVNNWSFLEGVTASAETVSIPDLNEGTRYTYQVRGSNDYGSSDWTSSASFTTPKVDAPKIIYTDNFFDGFSGAQGTSLHNRPTEDGSSTWQVWTGKLEINAENNLVAGTSSRSVGVVRTSAHDASLYMEDLDGAEGIVLRGSDAKNYIFVGGKTGGTTFTVTKVEDGVATELLNGTMAKNSNIRVTAIGDTISVYRVGGAGSSVAGLTPTYSVKTDFNMVDPSATYFGVTINASLRGWAINDFNFQKLG